MATIRERKGASSQLKQEEAKYSRSIAALKSIRPQRTSGGIVWKDEVNDRTYRRIIGGAAWPGHDCFTPTCHMAILGEDRETDVASGSYKIWLLFEDAAPSVEALLAQICIRMESMLCSEWVMPVEDPGFVRVENWIKERRKRRLPVPQVIEPPLSSFLELNALMQARTVTTKSFYFGAESAAAATYMSVPDVDFGRNLNRYPQVGAVLYPLGYLDSIQKHDRRRERYIPAQGGY